MLKNPNMLRLLIVLAILAGIAAFACSSSGDSEERPTSIVLDNEGLVPIPGNSELVIGPNRFALALLNEDNRPILDEDVFLRFFYGEELKSEQQAGFTYAIPGANGFYTANVNFDAAGQWTVEAVLTQDGAETLVTFTFPVREESASPNVGDAAPASTNLTLATEPNIKRLSTDQEPEPALYETTVADAIALGKPVVVVFATPAFCQTRFCGPVVENVKEVRQDFLDTVTFIHIEPFDLDEEGQIVTTEDGGPSVSAPMLEWNLQTEPWVFVLNADGIVAARFEGAASPTELTAAIEAALGYY